MANGRIEIDIGVDSSEATGELATLDKALDKFGNSLNDMGGDFEQVFDDLDASAAKLSKQTGDSLDKTRGGLEKLSKGAKDTGKELSTGGLKKGTDDSIKGLDSLKGGAGEVSSSFGQFGGAIGVLSPELGGMASQMGALAGGLEGAAKMTKLTGGSMKTLAIAGGALGVVVGTIGVAWKIFSSRLNAANERIRESHIAMEEGIKQAHAYKFTIQGLKNQIGLLGDAEFAVIDARKKSNDAMAEETNAQEAKRVLIKELAGDIEGLTKFEKELASGKILNSIHGETQILTTRNISKALKEMNAQSEEGIEIDRDAGLSAIRLIGGKRGIADASKLVRTEIENTKGMLAAYQGEVDMTARKTERMSLMLQAQSAIARGDKEEIRQLALSIAILDDAQNMLTDEVLRTAEAMAIQSLQMMNMGPATAVAIAGVQKQFEMLRSAGTASDGFAKTLAKLNTKLKGTADATADATDATKELLSVQERINEQTKAQNEAYANAQSLVALELSDREAIVQAHRDQKAEFQSLLADELITYEQYAAKMVEIDEQKAEDLLANDIAVAQGKIATAEMFNNQLGSILDASMDKRAAAIDADEAAALANSEGNAESQEAIRAKFDEKRKSELGTLFKLQKAAQMSSAIMSGASAAIGALAPPPIGLGPNAAGIAMAILVSTAASLQIGLIASQQPAFHQGGIVGGQGDQAITAQGGEVVLNREAVAAMGGPSAAAGLNQGGGGGGTIVIQNVYKQRVFDAVIADNLAKGGPLKSALNSATRAGRRGRVGGLL